MDEERSEVEEAADDGDLSDHEGGVKEARVAVGRKSPKMPTKAEIEEHARTHLPYRSWCRHCVRGRGKEEACREGKRSHDTAEVHMDFMFMGDEGSEKH